MSQEKILKNKSFFKVQKKVQISSKVQKCTSENYGCKFLKNKSFFKV